MDNFACPCGDKTDNAFLWCIEEISQDVAEQAYPATIPALTVSESRTISQMNAVARALLGTRVNRFSMLVNAVI